MSWMFTDSTFLEWPAETQSSALTVGFGAGVKRPIGQRRTYSFNRFADFFRGDVLQSFRRYVVVELNELVLRFRAENVRPSASLDADP